MTKTMMTNKNEISEKHNGVSPSMKRGEYTVDNLCDGLSHKLAYSQEGYPMIFIECSDDKITSSIRLKLFNVNFNKLCKLDESGKCIEQKYTIVKLLSSNKDFQKYFLEVMCLVLNKLPQKPKVEQLKREISKIISLFTASIKISKDTLKGLWAELFVIEQSKNPLYLIKAWHVSTEDKYDFNDGVDKIEVKSTSNEERIHHFAIEQLNPNSGSQLVIASLIVANSGIGKNIFDLVDSISKRISDTAALLKLNEEVMQTIGCHIDEAKEIYFDYTLAKNNMRLYDFKIIPAIALASVPVGVTAVHFASCLKGLPEIDRSKLKGNLHNSI